MKAQAPELMIDGEMHGDAALVESIRNERMPDSPLKGSANILVMPNMEAARISCNLLRVSSSRRHRRTGADGRREAGAISDANCFGTAYREYGRAGGC